MVCCNMSVVLLSMKRDFVREMGKCENVYFAAKWVKFLHKRVREWWIWERGSKREIGEEDQRGESLGVWLGSLFIEPSYVTRL